MGIEEFLLERERKKGREDGILKAKTDAVKSMLVNTDFSEERIAKIVEVTVEFVQKVKGMN